MTKRKRDKQPSSKKRNDGSVEIQRAEKRLAKALAEVDAGREKVARREHDLAELMALYGRTAVLDDVSTDAIPLAAPSYSTGTNGGSGVESESAVAEMVEEPVVSETDAHHG